MARKQAAARTSTINRVTPNLPSHPNNLWLFDGISSAISTSIDSEWRNQPRVACAIARRRVRPDLDSGDFSEGGCYSFRSATTGSTRVARNAGR